MKKMLILMLAALAVTATAQVSLPPVPQVPRANHSTVPEDSVFICLTPGILTNSAFARCFAPCDTDGDGVVSLAEARVATRLDLSPGGRKNIIGSYDFLRHFPNLTHLHLGNAPLKAIDLSRNPKLEHVDCSLALWLRRLTLAKGCTPRIVWPSMEGDFTITIVP